MERYQKDAIRKDLNKKMVLLAGPRQAGKTTLAKEIGEEFKNTTYLNYDRAEDRKIIKNEAWLPSTDLLILDEIHKMKKWKNFLKGVYDTKPATLKILVTGSARLEVFKQVGDSLAGRFFLHRLLPFSMAELSLVNESPDLDRLLERGGFPEPYLADSAVDAERWRLQYADSLVKEDVLDFENIQDLRSMQLVLELIRSRVGSPVSYTSLAEDVSVSVNTVKKYLRIFDALYITFSITPFSKNIARSLLKEPKIYFFDTGMVKGDIGARFENLMAISLLKHVYAKIDYEAKPYALHYLRTKEKHEVDFALVHNGQIEKMIEAKLTKDEIGRGLKYFSQKYAWAATQVVKSLSREQIEGGVEIVAANKFLTSLAL